VTEKINIVIGAYGSGKSEYAVNLALNFMTLNNQVSLVDLDIVNPYFRSRDLKETFSEIGIEVISPDGEYKHADLPMLSPRIMGAVMDHERKVILDVGGDPAGCRTLARYVENINKRSYCLQMVINTKRPFTSNAQEILYMVEMLQKASNLRITELICNTNLLNETETDDLEEGIMIIEDVADKLGVVFNNYLVLDRYKSKLPDNLMGKKRIVMDYFLRKPWEYASTGGI